jgi:hypothetical protein
MMELRLDAPLAPHYILYTRISLQYRQKVRGFSNWKDNEFMYITLNFL